MLYRGSAVVMKLGRLGFVVTIFCLESSANFLTAGDSSRKCIPTDIAIGNCYSCQCSTHGIYWCTEITNCTLSEPHFQYEQIDQTCEPGVLYQTADHLCTCSEDGNWLDSTCEKKFQNIRSVIHKSITPTIIEPDFICVPGLLYLVECNICICTRKGSIDPISCTRRSCQKLTKVDKCSPNHIVRFPTEVCPCDESQHIIEAQCAEVEIDAIQRITNDAINKITGIRDTWIRLVTYHVHNCDQSKVYKIDCNNCACKSDTTLICSKRVCFSRTLHESLGKNLRRNKRTLNSRTHEDHVKNFRDLEELQNSDSDCVPGRNYRVKCNTCICEKSGQLSCTTMICPGISRKGIDGTVPSPCEPGKSYKVECNTCHCTSSGNMICTKMYCMSDEERRFLEKDIVQVQRTNQVKLQDVNSEDFLSLPELRNSAAECEPGIRYRVDCNTCSCLDDGYLVCTRMMCLSHKDIARVDSDEFSGQTCDEGDRIEKRCVKCKCGVDKKFECSTIKDCHATNVPSRRFYQGREIKTKLDPKTDQCHPGFMYKDDCNRCYCQPNGELRCTLMGCLRFHEVRALEERRAYLEANDHGS